MAVAFLTGATGFIGSNLTRALINKGYEIRILLRKKAVTRNVQGLPVEIFYGDILDKDSLLKGMKGADYVFHVAALFTFWYPSRDFIYKVNIEGTKNVMECAMKTGVKRVVYTSTAGTCGAKKNPNELVDEEHPFNLHHLGDPYTNSKFHAEKIVKEFADKGLDVVIVNPTAPLGMGDVRPTPTGLLFLKFLNGEIPGYIEGGANFVNVRDVAEGHILALEKGKRGEKYILGGENMSMKEFLTKVAKIAGISPPRFKIPYPLAWLYALYSEGKALFDKENPPLITRSVLRGSGYYLYVKFEKARKELGYNPSPIDSGIREEISWFLRNGYIKEKMEEYLKLRGF
jgi:dihydroflavonol-4-reductase